MAQFRKFNSGNIYNTIQDNGSSLPQEQILNFIGTQFTIADDPGNSRTNITFPDFLLLSGGTMLGNLILNADPTTGLQAATKQYVDSLSAGLSVRTSCLVATTAELTATYSNGASGVGAILTNAGVMAAFAADGVTVPLGARVLVKNQNSNQFQNGIFTLTTAGSGAVNWVLTRATDYDTTAEVFAGTYTIITSGSTNATNMFVMTQTGTITMGTTAIVFSAFNSAANINVTAPITKSGNTIALTTPLAATYGGTGVANSNTITLGGNISTAAAFTTSGANALTLTTTGSTNVTLPTTGTLVNTAVTTLSSLASIGTITTGIWNGTLIGSTYGGTGVNNGSSTITLGGSLTTSGAFASTFTMTNTTAVTFPTSGTLATTSQVPSLPISLTNGGTNASLTASNGGIFYSTATAGAILSGTATAGQLILSGATAAPTWSTSTYPSTNAINTLLYASSANTMAALATGNSGVLITSAGGVPSISSTLPTTVQGNITGTGALASGSLAAGFTVVTVPLGGTGKASATAYTVQCGGTTSTGAHQNVSGVGTSGQLLTSSGAAALPTWKSYSTNIQIFTGSGTYTPTSGMLYCIVECVGGGGGGGGCTAGAANYAVGGGGGSGSYARSSVSAATIGASQTVTIGAAGSAGSSAGGNGGAGGDTSVGSLVIGKGGSGGLFTTASSATNNVAAGGAGGIAGTGTITVVGRPGKPGRQYITDNLSNGGDGGDSLYGSGGIGAITGQIASGSTRVAPTGYGAGGDGGAVNNASQAGDAGTAGLVIVTEFIVS